MNLNKFKKILYYSVVKVALKPFLDKKFKKILGIEPAKNLAKFNYKNKIKTFNGFLTEKNIKKIKKNADLILASNVFAHSDNLDEMATCMVKFSTIILKLIPNEYTKR